MAGPLELLDPATGNPVPVGAAHPIPIGGPAAPGATASGNPFQIGGTAQAGTPADAADGKVVLPWFDVKGRLHTIDDGQLADSADTVQAAGMSALFEAALTLDTSIYADLDVLSDLLTVTNAVRAAGRTARWVSLIVIDADDQGIGLDVLLFDRSVTLAAKNAAWATSDADMAFCQGIVQVAAADFLDLGGNRIAMKQFTPIVIHPNAGTSMFLATRSRGAGTYTAAGLQVKLGFQLD